MFKTHKYQTLFKFSFLYALQNYKTLIGLIIFLITCMTIFAHLWQVVADKTEAMHLHSSQLLWYIAFNEWLLIALPDIQDDIEEDLHSGRLAYLLPRPISYLWFMFIEGLGVLCARLIVLGFSTFIFTWIRTGDIPFTWSTFLFVIIIGMLAGCVGIIFKMLIGVSAFCEYSCALVG